MLNPRDTKILNDILAKPVNEVLEHEVAILRARASYLDEDQLKAYSDYLKGKKQAKKQEKKESNKSKSAKESKKVEKKVEKKQEKNSDGPDEEFKKLIEDAMELGIDTTGLTTKEEIEAKIDEELSKN